LLAPHQEEQGSEGEEAKWKRHQLHQCCGEPEILEQDNIIHVNGEDEENEVPLEEEEQPTRERLVKPSHNRVVMEVDQIDKAIASLACRDCGEAVKVTIKTVCVASSIGLECTNEECGFIYHPEAPAGTTIHLARGDNFERSTDYGTRQCALCA
jgi:hypothetical protein